MQSSFRRHVSRFTVLIMATGIAGATFLHAASAPQEGASQSEAAAVSSAQQQFITFLAAHPNIYAELVKQPKLVRDKGYLRQHPELAAFLSGNPAAGRFPRSPGGCRFLPKWRPSRSPIPQIWP